MGSTTKRILTILASYYLIVIIQACCQCSASKELYSDYGSINSTVNKISGELTISITVGEWDYVAVQSNTFNFINGAFACSCDGPGELGAKYEILEINIYPDSIFHADYDNSDPLNDLFDINSYAHIYNFENGTNDGNYELQLNKSNELYLDGYGTEIQLRTSLYPISSRAYDFTIELVKENGDKLYTTTEQIQWNI